MECDEQTPRKNPTVDVEEDIINLEQEFNFEYNSLKTVIEEELVSVNPVGGNVSNQMVITKPPVLVHPTTTHSERNPPRTIQSMKKGGEESLLNYQKYSFASSVEGKFKTENKMLTTYGKLKENSNVETQR